MSFWSMITTGEAVAGMRPRLTFCGMREPVEDHFFVGLLFRLHHGLFFRLLFSHRFIAGKHRAGQQEKPGAQGRNETQRDCG